jgi:hypothetical protein
MVSAATSGFGSLLKMGDGGVGAGAIAAVEWGTTTGKIRIKWKYAGTAGNGKNITVALAGARSVTTLDSTAVSVTGLNAAETVSTFIAWLYQQTNFDTYWNADWGATPGDGTGALTARTVTATSGGTDGTEVFTTIAEVKSISGPNLSAGVTDITNMDSASNTREFLSTLIDPGELTFDINLLGGSAQHKSIMTTLQARTKKNWKLYFTDSIPSYLSFAAYIVGMNFSAGIEDVLGASISLKITGTPTWTQI